MVVAHYNAESKRAFLLRALGSEVRRRRLGAKLTLKALAESAHVSQRFLVQLEQGEGNISVGRLTDIAIALGTTASALLEAAEKNETWPQDEARVVALL